MPSLRKGLIIRPIHDTGRQGVWGHVLYAPAECKSAAGGREDGWKVVEDGREGVEDRGGGRSERSRCRDIGEGRSGWGNFSGRGRRGAAACGAQVAGGGRGRGR